jgi:hypothetical protein
MEGTVMRSFASDVLINDKGAAQAGAAAVANLNIIEVATCRQ